MVLLLVLASLFAAAGFAQETASRPNIVLVMVDDMGFSDIGPYGGEIETPNLDALAAGGVRFTQFYNTGRCCPTRASLLTGIYPHQAGVGWMMADNGYDGYRGEVSRNAVTIAELLRPAGYGTYMSGKWHLTKSVGANGPKDNWPRARGFDRFFGTIHGAGSFYDPNSLTLDDEQIVPGDDFYYTDATTDWAVQFIEQHHAARPDDPLFLYLSYTAPHWPMHALPEDIRKYDGRYDEGWDALREERWRRMLDMGIVEERWGMTERDRGVPTWETAEDREWHVRRMEVYAAMIDRVDQQLGRVLDCLKRTERFEDTLIMFLADNGGCAEEYGSNGPIKPDPKAPVVKQPMQPGELQTRMQPRFTRDGLPVRTGRGVMPGPADTYIAYGKGWANASHTPFRRYKHWVHEGGIATPLIVHWPARIAEGGSLVGEPGHLIDIMATCADVSGATYPVEVEGRRIQPLEGLSLVPAFAGERLQRTALFWEHEGNRAVRQGDLKLVAAGKGGPWELYNLAVDRTERFDLAAQRPEIAAALAEQWSAWARRAAVLPLTPYWQSAAVTFSKKRKFTLDADADLNRQQAPDVGRVGFEVVAKVRTDQRDGVIVAQGGSSHGWSLFLREGKPHFAVRRNGRLTVIATDTAVSGPSFTVRASFERGGRMTLEEGGHRAAGKAQGLLTQMPIDGLQVGCDKNGAVADYQVPFPLEAELDVTIALQKK